MKPKKEVAPKTKNEVRVGVAEVRDVFHIAGPGTVAGCFVTRGFIKLDLGIRVVRDGHTVHFGAIEHISRFGRLTRLVNAHLECGVVLKDYTDFKVGDLIECWDWEVVPA